MSDTPSIFAAAEGGRTLSPESYEPRVATLRSSLLKAQLALRERKFSVILIVGGADGAGKGELVHRLNEWLEPRGVATDAFWQPSDEERERPEFWRFWRAMPAHGRIGIFFGSWYSLPIVRRVFRDTKKRAFEAELDRIRALERMLAADGTVIVKLWLHLSKKQQKKRLKHLDRAGRIAPGDWKHFKHYDAFTAVSARAIARTDVPHARWHVIGASDRRHREFTAGQLLLDAIEKSVARRVRPAVKVAAADRPRGTHESHRSHSLASVDLTQKLSSSDYRHELAALQHRLSQLAWKAQCKGVSTVLAFEGWDAAGKGSAIRRVTQAMDPRLFRVIGIAAPNDEERAHHYLWRFWRHVPRAGFTAIFDRTWYGRVLVERVEGFATAAEWGRAYDEINAFEEQLAAGGIVLCKFWIHVSPAEQLRRFKERETVAYKRYKITDEDWRNREKWPAYARAVDDMIARCHTPHAPWTLVAGDDKRFARVQILKTVVARLEAAL
ncbi:MAG TPA: polyphosphate:AMP phosphotransferase [Opitutus sp.]|nr:polyphosphate:AMP phosphotransferase [Opitutus sp.]